MGSSPAYPSDLTDAQWALIEPLVPVLSTRGRGTRGGRPPKYPRRRGVDAIVYVTRTGCSWRQLPHDFPPWETIFYYFQRWRAEGTIERIYQACATRPGTPTGAIRPPRPGWWTPSRCPARPPSARARAAGTPASGQRPQATPGGRHRRAAGRGAGDRGQRGRPRRQGAGVGPGQDGDALAGPGLGRCRLQPPLHPVRRPGAAPGGGVAVVAGKIGRIWLSRLL